MLSVSTLYAQSDSDSVKSIVPPEQVIITQPEFKGGLDAMYEYVMENFQYPEEASKRWISGKVEVEFTIEKSGDVTYVSILKGLGDMVDVEVLRLLKAMPRWTPATRNGVPVRYKVSMPLNIKVSRTRNSPKSELAL